MNLTGFAAYVTELEDLVVRGLRGAKLPTDAAKITRALNGGPAHALRKSVSLKDRQSAGTFFTGPTLGDRVLDTSAMPASAVYLDPTCGTGDLLLRSAAHLPATGGLEATLEYWGDRLVGFDLQSEFVRAARARLALYALGRVQPAEPTRLDLDHLFPKLRCADGLQESVVVQTSTHVLLNPPYTRTQAPQDCSWATGKTSAAAIFCEHILSEARPGTRLWAILPDVLRTGSLYGGWRKRLESLASIEDVSIWGAFDSNADVDVFILRATATNAAGLFSAADWWARDAKTVTRFGEKFSVAVGPVVPHRHPANVGVDHPFLHARNAPAWKEVVEVTERRQFTGRVFNPPFVAVRRTSSPSDAHRAVATVVAGQEPVAVENHLIVLQPQDGTLDTCRSALESLRHPAADAWFNERIRCRHLTVDSIRDLPWPVFAERPGIQR